MPRYNLIVVGCSTPSVTAATLVGIDREPVMLDSWAAVQGSTDRIVARVSTTLGAGQLLDLLDARGIRAGFPEPRPQIVGFPAPLIDPNYPSQKRTD